MTRGADAAQWPRAEQNRRHGVAHLLEVICSVTLLAIVLARTLLSETFVVLDVEFLGGSVGLSPAGTARLDLITLILASVLLFLCRFSRVRFGCVAGFLALTGGALVSARGAGDPPAAMLAGGNLVIALIACSAMSNIFQQIHWRRIALAGVFAVTTASAYRCISQRYYEFPATIEAWGEQKKDLLARGMRPNDPMIENYERRMRSLEAYGYHYHPNVAGSMLMAGLLVCTSSVLAASRLAPRRATSGVAAENPASAGAPSIGMSSWLALAIIAIAAYAMKLTGSSGAMLACAAGAVALFVGYRARHRLAAHPRRSAALLIAAYFAVIFSVAIFGAARGTLPGSSLAFRWEYWTAAMRAFATAPMVGIGRENFQDAYCRFKSATSVEEVRDPHDVWVSLLVELGPLGLIGGVILFATWLTASLSRLRGGAAPTRDSEKSLPSSNNEREAPDADAMIVQIAHIGLGMAVLIVALTIQVAASGTSLRDANIALLWCFETAGVALCGGAVGWALVGRAMQSATGDALLRSGALAASGAMLIHALVDYALLTPAGIALFAILAAASSVALSQSTPQPARRGWSAVAAMAATGLLAFVLVHWRLAAEPARRDLEINALLNDLTQNARKADDIARSLEALSVFPAAFTPDTYARSLRTILQFGQSAQLTEAGETAIFRAMACMSLRTDANPNDAATWELRAQALTAIANRENGPPLAIDQSTASDEAFAAIRRAVECNPTNPRVRLRAAEMIIKLMDPLESKAPRLSANSAIPFAKACLDEAMRIDAQRPPEEVMRLRESELKRIEDCRHDLDSIADRH